MQSILGAFKMADNQNFKVNGKPIGDLRVVDLKKELQKRGLSQSGNKKDLLQRLKEQLALDKSNEEDKDIMAKPELDDGVGDSPHVKLYMEQRQKMLEEQLREKRKHQEELRRQSEGESSEAETTHKSPMHSPPPPPTAAASTTSHARRATRTRSGDSGSDTERSAITMQQNGKGDAASVSPRSRRLTRAELRTRGTPAAPAESANQERDTDEEEASPSKKRRVVMDAEKPDKSPAKSPVDSRQVKKEDRKPKGSGDAMEKTEVEEKGDVRKVTETPCDARRVEKMEEDEPEVKSPAETDRRVVTSSTATAQIDEESSEAQTTPSGRKVELVQHEPREDAVDAAPSNDTSDIEKTPSEAEKMDAKVEDETPELVDEAKPAADEDEAKEEEKKEEKEETREEVSTDESDAESSESDSELRRRRRKSETVEQKAEEATPHVRTAPTAIKRNISAEQVERKRIEAPKDDEVKESDLTSKKLAEDEPEKTTAAEKPSSNADEEKQGKAQPKKRKWDRNTAAGGVIFLRHLQGIMPGSEAKAEAKEKQPKLQLVEGDEAMSDEESADEAPPSQLEPIRRTVVQRVRRDDLDGEEDFEPDHDEDDAEPVARPNSDVSGDEADAGAADNKRRVLLPDANGHGASAFTLNQPERKHRKGEPLLVADDAQKVRDSSPARNQPSTVLYVRGLTRPYTLMQLRELLQRTGKLVLDSFWIDKIKSRCLVKYESVDEATATRDALNGSRWPDVNDKLLRVDFSTNVAIEAAIEQQRSGTDISNSDVLDKSDPDRMKQLEEERLKREEDRKRREKEREERREKLKKEREEREAARAKKHDRSTDRRRESNEKRRSDEHRKAGDEQPRKSAERRDEREAREKEREKEKEEEQVPVKLLDDLFKKTAAQPPLYWLPLTEEQATERWNKKKADEEAREKHRAERELEEKKREEEQRMRRQQQMRARSRSRSRNRSRGRERAGSRGRGRASSRSGDRAGSRSHDRAGSRGRGRAGSRSRERAGSRGRAGSPPRSRGWRRSRSRSRGGR